MKANDFNKSVNSSALHETIMKKFGTRVDLSKYSREQLEDIRNQFRTRIFQQENQAGFNDLLTNETYQKDKAILQLLNTRIKEMLGEDIKKLKDKLVALEEAKKGVLAPKFKKHAKGSKGGNDGDLANNYPPYNKVTRGDVIAGATGKDQKGGKKADESVAEGLPMVKGPNGNMVPKFAADGKGKKDLKKEDEEKSSTGGTITRGKGVVKHKENPNRFSDEPHAEPPSQAKGQSAAEKQRDKASAIKLPRHSGNTWGMKGGEKFGKKMEESEDACNHTPKGKKCPVHGMKECGTMEGKDEGKPGKNFAKIAKKAGEKYGSKAAGERVAGAVRAKLAKQGKLEEANLIFKRHVRIVNESLAALLAEDEEGKAKAITAAGDMVNDYTSWMQRVGQYQTKSMIELADAIRADFGAAEAETFKQAVGPALSATLEVLTQQREAISNAVAVLAGEAAPEQPMGMEPEMGPEEPGLEPSEPDMMNEPSGDELAASEPASTGREMRESRFSQKLAESHSIIARLAR